MQSVKTSQQAFADKLREKAMELYGSPFDKISESHQSRVRSEVTREADCAPGDLRSAFDRGYVSGRAAYRLGVRSDYVWFTSDNDPSEYLREYSRGYRAAWVQAQRKYADRIDAEESCL